MKFSHSKKSLMLLDGYLKKYIKFTPSVQLQEITDNETSVFPRKDTIKLFLGQIIFYSSNRSIVQPMKSLVQPILSIINTYTVSSDCE